MRIYLKAKYNFPSLSPAQKRALFVLTAPQCFSFYSNALNKSFKYVWLPFYSIWRGYNLYEKECESCLGRAFLILYTVAIKFTKHPSIWALCDICNHVYNHLSVYLLLAHVVKQFTSLKEKWTKCTWNCSLFTLYYSLMLPWKCLKGFTGELVVKKPPLRLWTDRVAEILLLSCFAI